MKYNPILPLLLFIIGLFVFVIVYLFDSCADEAQQTQYVGKFSK